jgi:3-hydroxyisobutyrate dehydrogenase-like beta-hydroxyacid dehydrogenase
MKKAGFIGLGNIGKGITKNLIKAGYEMTVYDISQKAMEQFQGKAKLAKDVLEVHTNADYIFLSLPNSNVVEETVGKFLEAGMKGKTILDTSTSYPLSTRALYKKVREQGGQMVDVPLMGGPEEAEKGILDIVVAGDQEAISDVEDLLKSYTRHYEYVGEAGNAHLIKIALNFCGLSQALLFAQVYPVMAKLGFPQEKLYKAMNTETFSNWIFNFYSKKYIEQDYHLDFALALGLKDLTYMKKLFEDLNIPAFLLDGALDLCRVTLQRQKQGETLDFSHASRTLYEFLGISEEKTK